jgi:hypothetical protein
MGGKKKTKSGKDARKPGKNEKLLCGGCKNFDSDKKGGYCRYRDKKRSASDKACGNYKAR